MATLTWLLDIGFWLNILKVAVGLGFVIFLHELGHFLLAKWNGVKVEKFSIGFGKTIVGFTRGETEYVLAAIPLGGFVKMLGEGQEGGPETKSTDPRAYPNKSVGSRMAIISAGVIMNVFLGLACFVYAYGHGMRERPARVGAVMAGTPAYEAGLKPGDEIVAIDDRKDVTYDHLMLKVALSSGDHPLRFDYKRAGEPKLRTVEIEPRREATAEKPSIGIIQEESLVLAIPPYEAPAGTAAGSKEPAKVLKSGDILVAVGPEETTPVAVSDAEQYHRLLARWADKPLVHVFERRPEQSGKVERIELTLPRNPFVDFGLRLAIEPIATIQNGSIAEQAGFRKGDKIVKVNEKTDFDPMRLPTDCYQSAGQPMTFEVERRESGQAESKIITITVTPDDTPAWTGMVMPSEPVEIPGLGLAYPVQPHVEAVISGSPADRAGIKKGDTINALAFVPPADPKEKELWANQPRQFEFKEDKSDWAYAFFWLQVPARQEMKLTINHSNKPIGLTPEPDPEWFNPLRGLAFRALTRELPPQPVAVALKRGFDDTVDNILMIYSMIRSLVAQRVSPKLLGGPPAIAYMAYASAASGWTPLIHFLGLLSINLAVINFLPIPPLDGGQMAFLIAEKIRGRPLPDSAMILGSWIGLLLVLALLIFVSYQDVTRMLTG